LCGRVSDLDAIGEGYAPDDLGQPVFVLRSSPGFVATTTNMNRIGRYDQRERHQPRGVLRRRTVVRMDRWRMVANTLSIELDV